MRSVNFIFIKWNTHDIKAFFYFIHDVTAITFFKFNTLSMPGILIIINDNAGQPKCKFYMDGIVEKNLRELMDEMGKHERRLYSSLSSDITSNF